MIGVLTVIVYTAGSALLQNLSRLIGQDSFLKEEFLQTCREVCHQLDTWMGCQDGRTWQALSSVVVQWQANSQEKLYTLVTNGIGRLVKGLAGLGVILLIGFIGAFLLMRHQYALLNSLKDNYFYKEIKCIASRVTDVAASFIKTQSIIMSAMALSCAVGIFVLRLGHPILAGIGIAVLDAFPVLGSGMILVPWAVLRLMKGSVVQAIGLLILYVITVCIRELLEPKLMGHKLDIHPFYMLMATVIGVQLFGFWGIFTGPLALVIIREILDQMDTW
jgi:sporulation integral membrane protein YtvI